ncbi:hypothetical protein [Bosea sp. BIWAKO-01]|uniref:hypothetical protein n=1 Tax=Bosea sp. BIWAKO-01 TaxID=506668 RepID=UPI00085381C6|nr:hypothetical protein [Bosea sp. BIWAKO-01]GAU85895.1 hypothetical protein BIWAKO_05843 [Bosea sp. BIWAKO-01]
MVLSENLDFTVTKLKQMIISGDAGEGAVVFPETDTEATLDLLKGLDVSAAVEVVLVKAAAVYAKHHPVQ